MKRLHGLEGLRAVTPGSVLTIGNFDGLHVGHREILRLCRNIAGDGEIVVVTFEPHPLVVLRPHLAPPRISTAGQKRTLLEELGVDTLVTLPPEPEVLGLPAEGFWALLRDKVRPRALVEGTTFTFGKGRGGTMEQLLQWSAGTAIEVKVVDPVQVALGDMLMVDVSSSLVRWLIHYGRMRDVTVCLERTYTLSGTVIHGHHRGRTIGVPTANLQVAEQLIPGDGVYAGACTIGSTRHAAAISVGTNPTFEDGARQVEVHLLQFQGDLYGQTLDVEFIDFVREQRRYSGIEPLREQILADLRAVERTVALHPLPRWSVPASIP